MPRFIPSDQATAAETAAEEKKRLLLAVQLQLKILTLLERQLKKDKPVPQWAEGRIIQAASQLAPVASLFTKTSKPLKKKVLR